MKNKKGQVLAAISLIAGIALTLAIAIIVTGLTVTIVDDVQVTQQESTCIVNDGNANCSAAFNASESGLRGMENFSDNFTTIGTVAGAVVLIGMVVGGLGVFVGSRLF